MKEKVENIPQFQEEIKSVDSIEQIKEIPEGGNFTYKGKLYHKLNESFAVKAKIEEDKIMGDGNAFAIEDIDKEDE